MPFPTPKEYFIQGVGKPDTQQHIDRAWYHQPLPVRVLYHLSSKASDVPIFRWHRKILYIDPLQSQLGVFRCSVITCLGRVKPCIIGVTRDGKIVVFLQYFSLKREQVISIENVERKGSMQVLHRCRQP